MRLLIGADLVPTQSNIDLFTTGNAETLVGQELLEILKSSDYRIFNLEVPLTNTESSIEKCGPALIAPTETVRGYTALGVDCLTLANNHIMDQGNTGFFSTVKTLDENKISHVGGGANIEEAQKPFIIEKDGRRIGIYACAEHEFSIATETSPGANPFDPLESLDHLVALRADCDYVIVLYHGGKEHYRYPSPLLQKRCRKIIEKGADLVLCQHSHCIGCEEKYKNGTVVYGQGNFLFDHSKSDYWQTSLLVQVDDNLCVSYIPLEKHDNLVRLASPEHAQEILDAFYARSEEIKDSEKLQMRYRELAISNRDFYLLLLSSINRKNIFFRVLNKLSGYRFGGWLLARQYKKQRCLVIRNFIECEAHSELFSKVLIEKNAENTIPSKKD